jgi:hypothetical protein
MAAEITVVYRDDEYGREDDAEFSETYETWVRARLEETTGITVMSVDIEEV